MVCISTSSHNSTENKGPGNLRFVPGLVDAYRAVLAVAQRANLTVNADIQNKLLKGDRAERKMLLTALPHFTLMLYEVSSPTDGESPEQQEQKIVDASEIHSPWPTTVSAVCTSLR